ncbi:MAG: hypothetical protein IT515_07635 [Burkholderiales bacterium]|nr:hypothetical protein [Burkholderiales bacterium]
MVDLRLFGRRNFAVGVVSILLGSIALFGTLTRPHLVGAPAVLRARERALRPHMTACGCFRPRRVFGAPGKPQRDEIRRLRIEAA